jgi:ribonucleoside-diphosphate reductase alpha chain
MNIPEIPQDLREVYMTVWEMKQKDLIDMSADRGAFICQSQSLNLFIEGCNAAKLTSAHFYSWEKGLKTGMYYLRTKSAANALAGLGIDTSSVSVERLATVPAVPIKSVEDKQVFSVIEDMTCSLDNPDECIACGS